MLLARSIVRSIRCIATQTTLLSRNSLHYRFAETSRDIEQKMKQQKMKNLQNKFKALDSSFGLKRPQTVSPQYPKPSSIEYSLQSLRRCSHMYPEFLLKELNNKKSQFYEVIQNLINNLGGVDNKEAIQFLQFLSEWRLYLQREQYAQVIKRKIYQMKLDLNQLFTVIKFVIKIQYEPVKQMVLQDIEGKILDNILDIQQHEYQSLFKLLNFMRMHDLSPQVSPSHLQEANNNQEESAQKKQNAEQVNDNSFYKVVQKLLLRNLDNIPLPSLVEMIVHYANNVKEQQDDRINIMGKVQVKVIENLPFFNHDELIAIVYSYVKTNTQTERLINQFVTRIELLFFEISWENKKKIINMASSFPFNKWLYVVGISIFEVLKGKKVIHRDGQTEVNPNAKEVEFQLLPTIYLSSYETNLATPQLIGKLQSKILQQFFNYSAEDIGLIAWLFTITPPSLIDSKHNKDLLYTKLQAIIEGGFNASTFTLKDISMVVWSMCNLGGKSNAVYKQNAKFWNNIEDYVQDRIANNKEQKLLNGCCQILWAYTNNKPLSMRTVNMIIDIMVAKQSKKQLEDEMFIFELTTVTSFFYPLKHVLPKSINQFFHKLAVKYTELLVQQMDYLEIMKMLKCIIYDDDMKLQHNRISIQLWEQILDQFVLYADKIEYESMMGVVGFTIVSPQGRQPTAKAVQLVKKLMSNKQKMEQLKASESRSKA